MSMVLDINISINEETAKRIREYAEKNNTSISKIAEEQFDKLTLNPKKKGKSFVEKNSPAQKRKKSFVEKTAGIAKDIDIDDIDKARDEYLKEEV